MCAEEGGWVGVNGSFSKSMWAPLNLMHTLTCKHTVRPVCLPLGRSCFKKGVIELVDNGAGEEKAVVADARGCTFSREVHQHPDLTDFVRSVAGRGRWPPCNYAPCCIPLSMTEG